jgi:formate-dependent nitrite reductase cytochrome c552 subunit
MKNSKNQREVKREMCGNCHCNHGLEEHGTHGMVYPWPEMDVEEEVRMLEEYREALAKRLEKVNKRLEALKR